KYCFIIPIAIWVTPHAGVWIETDAYCGKYHAKEVTPHAGVWIETQMRSTFDYWHLGHAPRGRVD
ncbi:MAG TPA: hypothetical protein PK534_11795, partial [Chitinophagales bacterium]|nr:hypothetical protein [Chitinophagales bacterium]